MRLNGYETVFGTDLNGDGVISSEITDIDNNKRILNSANEESLVEVLLENNANN